jgi:NAD(P)-dependent dehydrogenase (short-subunit alcohol dehydrogenase family)
MYFLITGANRGIGFEFAKQYIERGNIVYATCRFPDQANELHDMQKNYPETLHIVQLDVSNKDSIHKAYLEIKKSAPRIDVLINNAAVISGAENAEKRTEYKFGDFHKENILKVFNINIVGPLLISEQFIDLLKESLAGKIINISSGMGSITQKAGCSYYSYSISKAALNMASKLLANDLVTSSIGVWAMDPGWNKTRMGGHGPLNPKDTVKSMISIIETKTAKETGKYLVWDGSELPW